MLKNETIKNIFEYALVLIVVLLVLFSLSFMKNNYSLVEKPNDSNFHSRAVDFIADYLELNQEQIDYAEKMEITSVSGQISYISIYCNDKIKNVDENGRREGRFQEDNDFNEFASCMEETTKAWNYIKNMPQ